MGLDTYASRTPGDVELTAEDTAAFEAAAPQLCGGMYSGGEASFRGKIYDGLILEATGESLYQEWITPEAVKQLAEKLGEYAPQQLAAISESIEVSEDRMLSAGECVELQKFLRVCAEQGLGLVGWW